MKYGYRIAHEEGEVRLSFVDFNCHLTGDTVEEALEGAPDALELVIDHYTGKGLSVPVGSAEGADGWYEVPAPIALQVQQWNDQLR